MTEFFAIDREQTKKLDQEGEPVSCRCPDCEWYRHWMGQLPLPAKDLFEGLGLDPLRCRELWACFPHDSGWSHYSGYFPVAVEKTDEPDRYSITQDWKEWDFGVCRFRFRLETAAGGETILGFEADLPELGTSPLPSKKEKGS